MQESADTRNLGQRLYALLVHHPITVPLLSGTVAFALDRVTKEAFISEHIRASSEGLHQLITLVHHENHGIVANLPIPVPVIILATLGVLVFVISLLVNAVRTRHLNTAIALGILLGGALGNLYDRTVYGFVFDWILLFSRSAINLADAFIVIGGAWYLYERRTESTAAPHPPLH